MLLFSILTHKSINNPKLLLTRMNNHAEPFHPNPNVGASHMSCHMVYFSIESCPFTMITLQLLFKGDGCEAYIDDMVIHGTSWKVHLECVHWVLTRFAYCQLEKSEFGHAEVTFLGHIVSNGH